MNIILAFDSYKGCLSSEKITSLATAAIEKIIPNSQVDSFITADGGEGTIDAIVKSCSGEIITSDFTNLNNIKSQSNIAIVGNTCIIECAQTVGITLSDNSHIEHKTTYGMGEQIKYALDLGIRDFAVGLGGSGTNDAGIGMLAALGFNFLDCDNQIIEPILKNISKMTAICSKNTDPRLTQSIFTVLSDVNNPLCGNNGATYIYGPQKGINHSYLETYDNDIGHFADIAANHFGFDKSEIKGAGAAGGLGYAFIQFLNADITSGIDYILELVNANESIKNCDLVFTGEGKTDSQTANGKVAAGVAKLAKKYSKPVVLISGALSEDAYTLHDIGIDYLSSIQDYPIDITNALNPKIAAQLFTNRMQECLRLIMMGKNLQK